MESELPDDIRQITKFNGLANATVHPSISIDLIMGLNISVSDGYTTTRRWEEEEDTGLFLESQF